MAQLNAKHVPGLDLFTIKKHFGTVSTTQMESLGEGTCNLYVNLK